MRDLHAEWVAAMRRGDDESAWAVSDLVLASRDTAGRDDPSLPYHRRWVWDGSPFDGRDVLVRCYHGLGDTLQFARFLPALRRRARSLAVETQPELIPLLSRLDGPDRLLPFVAASPAAPAACDMEIMELSHALRIPGSAVAGPYLRAPAASLPSDAIGLCWQAGGWDAARSIPLALIAQAVAGRPIMVLQPGPPALPGALNAAGAPRDIAGTAALIAGLGLVITVDTMVAHLAGALGCRTWLLLKHDADWRWGEETACTSWYPSMRLFRQPAPGDWVSVAADIVACLTAEY